MWKEYITMLGIKSDYFHQTLPYFNFEQTRISLCAQNPEILSEKELRGSYGKSMVFRMQTLLGQIWP